MASTDRKTPTDDGWSDRTRRDRDDHWDTDRTRRDVPDETNFDTGDLPGDETTGSKDPKKKK